MKGFYAYLYGFQDAYKYGLCWPLLKLGVASDTPNRGDVHFAPRARVGAP